jgi:hypothetical protein
MPRGMELVLLWRNFLVVDCYYPNVYHKLFLGLYRYTYQVLSKYYRRYRISINIIRSPRQLNLIKGEDVTQLELMFVMRHVMFAGHLLALMPQT